MNAWPTPTPTRETPGLPTGMVTFAFTDIEGSTVRWERYPAAMRHALRQHDTIMRAAIERHGGYVFTTTGDAFCCAFWSAAAAVAAMLDAQHGLAAEDFAVVDGLRVRAAVHAGTADERDADYFGPAVNRVARLLAIAHGGQMLVSEAARIALGNALPAGASLHDLGVHRLRDLTRSERVFQLVAPGLAARFPPLRSLDARHHNLPLQLTSFVGREAEVANIVALLAAHRLVTIVGAGGVGKTRGSLHAGAHLLDGSGDGVWFIELAPLANGAYLPTTVAQAMGIALRGEGDPLEALVAALRATCALLIFDNCEHLIAPAARAVAAILRDCPQIRILTTSRQSLGVSGEWVYRMPSLALPASGMHLTAADALRYPVLALFEERAATVDGRFRLTDDNASVVADVCRRLDGIPMAIELAAARIKILSPRQLRERLDERFRLLTGGTRDLLPRQQTLRALIDWSYDLLDDVERTVFRRLGTFVNGFTLDGAVALAGATEFDEVAVIDVLGSLVDQSLVMAEPDGDMLRYRMLESTQAYAREKLDGSGERAPCAARHLEYLGGLFGGAMSRATQTGSAAEIESLLIAELDNVRAALESAAYRSPEIGADLLAAIDSRWHWVTLGTEGAAHLQRFIALLPESEPRRAARLWTALARIERDTRPALALEAATAAVRLARESSDAEVRADALVALSDKLARARAFDGAAAALTEAEACAPADNVWLRLRLLSGRAFLSYFTGDLEAATETYGRLAAAFSAAGNASGINTTCQSLAEVQYQLGRTAEAVDTLRERLAALRPGRDRVPLLGMLANVAGYLIAADRLAEARAAIREALAHSTEPDYDLMHATCTLEHAALVIALGGDPQRAATLAGYTDAAFARVGYEREFTERATLTRLECLLAAGLGDGERHALCARGAILTSSQAVALATGGLEQDEPDAVEIAETARGITLDGFRSTSSST